MVRLAALALLALVWSGNGSRAETIRVQSGEHAGFSRLVFDFGRPVDWRMARTTSGYRLDIGAPDQRGDLRFDLSDVFRLIPRDRLSSIWVEPDSGAVLLGIGCACHAFPFELQSDVLVIDLRDGPAPPGSSFELSAEGKVMPPLASRNPVRPRSRPGSDEPAAEQATPLPDDPDAASPVTYDWLADAIPAPSQPVPKAATPDPAAVGAGLDADALRAALLVELGRAAAMGTVDLEMPLQQDHPAPDAHARPSGSSDDPMAAAKSAGHAEMDPEHASPVTAPPPDGAEAQIRIGATPGFDPAAASRQDDRMTGTGAACLPDAAIDIGAWGDPRPVAEAIGARTGALYGEFDQVDPEKARAALTYLLHLGFGAEVRGLLTLLPFDGAEAPVYRAMSLVLDGQTDPGGALHGMQVCDGAVALWAVLALPPDATGGPIQTGAILRAFSALPLHLRRHLGPMLADRLLARGDPGAVRAIRDAILRPGADAGPSVALMETELDAAEGRPADTDTLTALQAAPGPTAAAATIATVEALVARGDPVDVQLLTAVEALLREYQGAEEQPALTRALALAHGSQGNFDAAFPIAADDPAAQRDLWSMLARQGPDSAILIHALPLRANEQPDLPDEDRHRLSSRLLDLGFGTEALAWLTGPVPTGAEPSAAERVLAARAELQQRNARAVLATLAGQSTPEADALRTRALLRLGAPDPLARVMSDPAVPLEQRQAAARQARNWAAVETEGPEVWSAAAALTEGPAVAPGTPPLARAAALVTESAAARLALQTLLKEAGVATPSIPADGS